MAESMREAFQQAASNIFDAFGDVALAGVYVSKGPQQYSPASGALEWTDTEAAIRIIMDLATVEKLSRFSGRSDETGKANVYAEEVVGMVPDIDMALIGERPKKGDRVRVSGKEYTVEGFLTDPAEALWNLWLVR